MFSHYVRYPTGPHAEKGHFNKLHLRASLQLCQMQITQRESEVNTHENEHDLNNRFNKKSKSGHNQFKQVLLLSSCVKMKKKKKKEKEKRSIYFRKLFMISME